MTTAQLWVILRYEFDSHRRQLVFSHLFSIFWGEGIQFTYLRCACLIRIFCHLLLFPWYSSWLLLCYLREDNCSIVFFFGFCYIHYREDAKGGRVKWSERVQDRLLWSFTLSSRRQERRNINRCAYFRTYISAVFYLSRSTILHKRHFLFWWALVFLSKTTTIRLQCYYHIILCFISTLHT